MATKKYINLGHNEVVGNVTFGEGCILNPTCSIICQKQSQGARIIFGDYNVIEQKAIIMFKPASQKDNVMRIGSYNTFGIRTFVTNAEIGDCNTFQPKSEVKQAKIGNGNLIGSEVKLVKKTIGNRNRVFYPGIMKQIDVFDQERYKQNIKLLFTGLNAPPPK